MMTDEQTPPTEETPEVDPVEKWLKEASPDDIMKHDRIRGIFGSRIQQEREATEKRIHDEAQQRAREEAQAELDHLAETDQFAFSEKYLSKRQQEKIADDLAKLKSSTRTEFAAALGRGFQSLPETKELTPAEQESIARAMVGVSDDDAVIKFNAAMIDVIADRRASAKVATWTRDELAKEREAIRQEESSKRLKTSARPALIRNGAEPTKQDPAQLPDKEFNEWYTANVLGRRR